jgi:hypothetical protein
MTIAKARVRSIEPAIRQPRPKARRRRSR